MATKISDGTRVAFQYRQHQLLGGQMVHGSGVVTGETVVGSQDAYVIRSDSGDYVHVRSAGVRPA